MKTYISRLMLIASLLALLFVPPTYGGHSEERQHAAPAANASGKPADLLDLPIAAQGQISATLGRDQSSYHASRHGKSVRLGNPKHRIKAEFTAEDVRIGMGAAQWSLAFRGYAYGDKLQPAATTKPHAALNRVEYRRGELTEWYLNGPLGLEQGFTLSEKRHTRCQVNRFRWRFERSVRQCGGSERQHRRSGGPLGQHWRER